MNTWVFKLVHFPLWWYKDSLVWFKRFFTNLIVFLDNKLALRLMVSMFFVPMFHDVSWLGRILSIIYRLVRSILGLVVMVVVSLAMIFWLVFWLALPVIIVGVLDVIGWIILGLIWLIDTHRQINKPWELSDKVEVSLAKHFLSKEAKVLVKRANYLEEELKQLLLGDRQVQDLLKRIEIAETGIKGLQGMMIYQDWLQKAMKEAMSLRANNIETIHFILAWLDHKDWRYKEAVKTAEWLQRQRSWSKTPFLWDKEYVIRPIGGVDRALTGIPTPTLDKFSTDLTQKAQKHQLPEIIGKDEPLDQLSKILSRKQQNNVLIVGLPGSGKTTLVKGMGQEIVRGIGQKSLRFKRLVALDVSRLAAGANTAELNKRITNIIQEIRAAENIILFVDEVHNLASVNQDSPETSDLFIALEPPLSDGEFQFIGATTTDNYKKFIEPNEAFARLFEVVELKEASKEKALEVLEFLAFKLERSEEVLISRLCLETIVDLADQHVHDRVLPDSAVNLLDEVVAVAKTEEKSVVTSSDVEKLVTKKTKIPLSVFSAKEAKVLLNLESKLHKRVVGQNEAVKVIADAIRRARTKLKEKGKPIASFLFAGPTGVGKTETAKTLAAEFFGSEKLMVRLDMSEYQTIDSLNRLIGAPPGKSQAKEGGQLTEAIKHQPYSLVLLDEIEKAHPKILNVFLQVLDDARLTDSGGMLVDFSNTIIIATTNVGTRELIKSRNKKMAMDKLEEHYPPEFLNRFTSLVIFSTLSQVQVEKVVKLKLKKLSEELLRQEIKVEFEDQVVKKLARLGFSEKWGGRQVDRVIQEKVMNVVASKMLKGEIVKKTPVKFSVDLIKVD